MVVTRLIGGLGNQMFQYACGRALAEQYRVPLKLDVRGFNQYKLHQYLLGKFSISGDVAGNSELPKTFQIGPWSIHRFPGNPLRQQYRYVRERSFNYDPALKDQGPNVYLDGYWQSEKYFLPVRNILLKELQLVEPLDDQNKRFVERMSAPKTVALHVRRGDYVKNPDYISCGVEYYRHAVKTIAEQASDVSLFVFSDDPAWVQQHIHLDVPTTYLTHNVGTANYKDLVLMSQCAYSVVANSSFGWWGAWLKTRTDGFTIAPARWYTNPATPTQDLLPRAWKTLPV